VWVATPSPYDSFIHYTAPTHKRLDFDLRDERGILVEAGATRPDEARRMHFGKSAGRPAALVQANAVP
jgi:hypothetical protein